MNTGICRLAGRLRRPSRKALAVLAAVLILAALGGTAADAQLTGWNTYSTCSAISGSGEADTPDACDVARMNNSSDHMIDLQTSQNTTKALCVYDYVANPGGCISTFGPFLSVYGYTGPGGVNGNDGDTADSYGNKNVFTPTNRILSNGGAVFGGGVSNPPSGQFEPDASGEIWFCPAGDLVSSDSANAVNPACAHLTGAEVTALETAPSWAGVTLTNGWSTRNGYAALAVRKDAYPPDYVQMEGQAVNGMWGNGAQIGTVPSGFAPLSEQVIPANCGGGSYCAVTVEPNGAVKLWTNAGSGNLVQVGSASYVVSR